MAAAQTEPVKINDLVYRDGLFFKKFRDVPFTGFVSWKYDQGGFKEGKKQGKWTYYHDNGQLKLKGEYQLGIRDGEWVFYSEKGHLLTKMFYKSGKLHGPFIEYFKNGKKVRAAGNYVNGKREGTWEFFDYLGMKRLEAPHYKSMNDRDSYDRMLDTFVEPEIVKLLGIFHYERIQERYEEYLGEDQGSGFYKDGRKISP